MTAALLLRLAWRNLWRHSRRTFLTSLAFALGVLLLILSLGLGDGMHEKMIENAIRLGTGHVVVEARGAREELGEGVYVEAAAAQAIERELQASDTLRQRMRGSAPRLATSGLLTSASNSTGIQAIGVLAQRERGLALIPEKMVRGDFLTGNGRTPPVVVGEALANKLDLRIDSKVVLMAQAGAEIQSQLLRVRGIFSTGMTDFDRHVIALDLSDLQSMLGRPGELSHHAIFLNAAGNAELVQSELSGTLGSSGLDVLTWRQAMPELDQFIRIDDAGNYLFNAVLLFMVTLGVLNTVLMAVLERRHEFSLLSALGMRPRHIAAMVTLEGLLLTAIGTGAGLLIGLLAHAYFATYGLDLSAIISESISVAGVAIDSVVYSHLYPGRIPATIAFASLLGLSASVYPAIRAARTKPSEVTAS